MAFLVMQWDLPADPEATGYAAKAPDWIKVVLAQDGAVQFMAFRNPESLTPMAMTQTEFGTLAEARAAAASPAMAEVMAEMRGTGVTAMRSFVMDRSPFTPEPIRPRP